MPHRDDGIEPDHVADDRTVAADSDLAAEIALLARQARREEAERRGADDEATVRDRPLPMLGPVPPAPPPSPRAEASSAASPVLPPPGTSPRWSPPVRLPATSRSMSSDQPDTAGQPARPVRNDRTPAAPVGSGSTPGVFPLVVLAIAAIAAVVLIVAMKMGGIGTESPAGESPPPGDESSIESDPAISSEETSEVEDLSRGEQP